MTAIPRSQIRHQCVPFERSFYGELRKEFRDTGKHRIISHDRFLLYKKSLDMLKCLDARESRKEEYAFCRISCSECPLAVVFRPFMDL